MTVVITLCYFCYSFVFLYCESLFYSHLTVFYNAINNRDIIPKSPINLMLSYYKTLRQERKLSILDSELVFRGKQVILFTSSKAC